MRVRAFAKINLSLRVLGTRADGYHELRTIFQSIALHDTLTIRAVRGPFRLTCDDPACPADDTNLVWRAAARDVDGGGTPRRAARRRHRSRASAFRCRPGWAAAAATRRRRCARSAKRWRVGDAKVRAAAAALGADVPYFLEGGTVLGLERGDLLFPLHRSRRPRGSCWCCPDFGVSTKDAFGWFDARSDARGLAPSDRRSPGRLRGPAAMSWSTISKRRWPRVIPRSRRIVSALRRAGRVAGRDVGQRLGRIRPVFRASGRAARRGARWRRPRRRTLVTRTLNRQTYQSTCRHVSPSDKLTVCAAWFRPLLKSASSITRRRRAGMLVGRRQVVRRGSLDPVFEGSNPSAPANSRGAVQVRWVIPSWRPGSAN